MSKRLPNGLAWTLLGLTLVVLAANATRASSSTNSSV
jgi:hypothetical protein